jgi:tetratricopeptide (TPR) repeat protein
MLDDAIADHTLVLTYCRASGRGFGETASLLNLAEIEVDAGRPHAAMAVADEALRRGREIGDVRAEARAIEYTAAAWSLLGDHSRAIVLCHEALRVAGTAGAQFAMAAIALVLSGAYRRNGDPGSALHYAELGLRTVRDHGHLLIEATALSEAAHAHLDLGAIDLAREHAHTAIQLAQRRGLALVESGARRVLDLVGDVPSTHRVAMTARGLTR